MDNLLPCPFCGQNDIKLYTTNGKASYRRGYIRCNVCDFVLTAEGGGYFDINHDDYNERRRISQEQARSRVIEKWNTRNGVRQK